MFSDVSPDGQDEQGHDVSTHLPGPLGTILKFVQPIMNQPGGEAPFQNGRRVKEVGSVFRKER